MSDLVYKNFIMIGSFFTEICQQRFSY